METNINEIAVTHIEYLGETIELDYPIIFTYN